MRETCEKHGKVAKDDSKDPTMEGGPPKGKHNFYRGEHDRNFY